MLLGNLFKLKSENYKKISVNGISFDSRKVNKNDIFFAIKGNNTSGVKFIKQALNKGAAAIVIDKKTNYKNKKIPIIAVPDTRKTLAEVCSKHYRRKPSNIIAVTGTNGKSSVADFFYQILTLNKISAASIGTLGIVSKNYKKKTNLTSMNPLDLHKNLEVLKIKKVNNVIIEASSHGLDQKRIDSIKLNVGIFTNLSHDHLDYHKSMKTYFNSKMYLFKKLLKKNSRIITDEDNIEFNKIKNIAKKRKIKKFTIGSNSGNIRILQIQPIDSHQVVKILINKQIFLINVPLIGYFQIKNLFMAVLAASYCGINLKKIFRSIHKIKPVQGRLELVTNLKNNSKIIVDFSHTPDALKQSLIAIKKQFNKNIILVFGCGGDRDKKKRITMGRIAQNYCRKIFVTDDNPRNENPEIIRNTILKGCRKLGVGIGSREVAIKTAIKELQPNEILLIAGKGHEVTQNYGSKIINFSDKNVIKKVIKKNSNIFNKNITWSNIIAKKVFKDNFKKINYNNVSINTKSVKKNDLFIAIKGKNTDGHKFLKEAIKKGAVRCVINKNIKNIPKNKIIKVKNTFSILNDLARATRLNTTAKIIGVTGSVGKTTLKNLINFSLKDYGNAYCSPLSYNNKFGVPLSISNLKQNTDFGVFEIGMDKKGEIKSLSKIVKPEIGVITNISEAHFKNFNSLKDIAKAKAEIIENISSDGKIVLNKDDKFFSFLSQIAKRNKISIVSFSIKKKADIFLVSAKKIKDYYRLKVSVYNKLFYFDIKYNVNSFISNLLACISVLISLNLDLNKLRKKFINFSIPSGRGNIQVIKKFKKIFKLIDESYNANPLSMASAIDNMKHYKQKGNSKKIAFLGDMLELGEKSQKLHKELSIVINKSQIDKIYVFGTYIKKTFNFLSKNKKGKVFNSMHEAYNYFKKNIHNNDLLMIKGSNATGLNQFAKNFKKGKISVI